MKEIIKRSISVFFVIWLLFYLAIAFIWAEIPNPISLITEFKILSTEDRGYWLFVIFGWVSNSFVVAINLK